MDPFFLASQSSSDYCTIKEGVRKPSPVMPDARNSLVHCLRSVESIEKMLDVWNVGSPISLYALQEFHRGKKKWKQFLKQESDENVRIKLKTRVGEIVDGDIPWHEMWAPQRKQMARNENCQANAADLVHGDRKRSRINRGGYNSHSTV